MPRPHREEVEGGIHHVYARGNARGLIYREDEDRETYLSQLGEVAAGTGWFCHSYCLMDNHVHLLLETPRPNLGSGIQRLHGYYGQAFNLKYERSGHVFQGRYGASRMKSEAQLWATVAYIVRNPVEAEMCAEPGDWRWSSHRAVLGRERAPRWLATDRLLAHFEGIGSDPTRAYTALTAGIGIQRLAA